MDVLPCGLKCSPAPAISVHGPLQRERLLREEAGISTPDPLQPYHTAARRIQHAWRCYCNRKVFEFYRELITSR